MSSVKNPYNDPVYRKNRRIILERSNYICVYCGSPNANTADHLIPISQNGGHELENLVACCLSCNSTRQDRTRIRMPYANRRYLGNGLRGM